MDADMQDALAALKGKMSFEEFCNRYWPPYIHWQEKKCYTHNSVPVATKREFYSDYLNSRMSFEKYVVATSKEV